MPKRDIYPGVVMSAVSLLLMLQACGNELAPASADPLVPSASAPPVDNNIMASGELRTIDPDPDDGETSRVIEKEEIEVDGKPACAFSLEYAGAVPQPVTWRNERCASLTAMFMTEKQLADLGRMDRLSPEAKEDIERGPANSVFYVEGQFTASVYPLNAAGRIYEVTVAD